MFPNVESVIGEKIKIKDRTFRIVGILPDSGKVSFMDVDKFVIIPYSTAQNMLGIDYYQEMHIMATNEAAVPAMVADIQQTLRSMHDITDPKNDDFSITTQDSMINSIKTITTMLTVLLTSVAAISLVVGGVGIMNIMLVSVTERTREIGLRKALGATNGVVLLQFLVESVILTTLGGVIGIILGGTLSYTASTLVRVFTGYNFPFSSPIEGALLGIGVSAVIGLVFGLFPARQAALKSPMEALRYE
jgi:putative ABC transport system permease protein